MLVYGDAQRAVVSGELIERLCDQAAALLAQPVLSVSDARALLIAAGELEQAVSDARPDCAEPFHQLTALAADAFFALLTDASNPTSARASLQGLLTLLAHLDFDHLQSVSVKIPEGFAFYALYPEQYALAARRWSAEHPVQREVVVVGVRSIGTTLAAVVTAALRVEGWTVRSLTVRPAGHPFARTATLEGLQLDPDSYGIVADEGPGFSGSSMAAAAEALVAAGLRRESISFFPGHGGDPGGAGSEAVRRWWASTPRCVMRLADVRFGGLSLSGALTQAAQAIFPDDPVLEIEDFSGGLWRRAVYASADDYPAVCTSFERTKYRCTLASGARILWKFAGLAGDPHSGERSAEVELAQLNRREALGFGALVLGSAYGFVATRWIEGERLTRADAAPELLQAVGRYIATAAGEPLTPAEAEAAQARLRDLLYWNTWERLGEDWAEKTSRWGAVDAPLAAYGDGHLAPHEWIRAADGRLWKTDSVGHDRDHTLIGRQSVLWDVAAALVEWNCDDSALLDAFSAAFGITIDVEALVFYRAAYAAFRVGQCTVSAAHDANEAPRLRRAAQDYEDRLARLLQIG